MTRRKSTRSLIHSKSQIKYQEKKPKSPVALRNDSHESGSEKQGNKSKTGFRDRLVHNSGIMSGGRGRAGAGTGASRGRFGASGGCSCVLSSVTENVVVITALAGEAGLECLDILALGETVDAAVVVVLVGCRVTAALLHGIGDVTTNNGGAGRICCWNLPDAAAAGGAGCANGSGCGGHFVWLWFDCVVA